MNFMRSWDLLNMDIVLQLNYKRFCTIVFHIITKL
jgi:hypothetical protein